MKRAVISILLVTFACAAQAITFTWQVGPNAIEASGLDSNLAQNSLAYLVWDSGGGGFDGLTSLGAVQGDDVLISNSGIVNAIGGVNAVTVTFSDGQSYTTGSGGTAKLNAGSSASMYLVVFDATTIGAAQNYNASVVKTLGMTPASGSPVTSYAFADADIVKTTWQGGLNPVPEPTSIALFGLGVGVLALRRRFKKAA